MFGFFLPSRPQVWKYNNQFSCKNCEQVGFPNPMKRDGFLVNPMKLSYATFGEYRSNEEDSAFVGRPFYRSATSLAFAFVFSLLGLTVSTFARSNLQPLSIETYQSDLRASVSKAKLGDSSVLKTVDTDPDACTEARGLLSALFEIKEYDQLLFGHEEDNVHGQRWQDRTGSKPWLSDIKNWTGSYPGMFGYSFQSHGIDDWDYSEEVKFAYEKQGGVIEFVWAAYNPITLGDENNITSGACLEVVPGGSAHEVWKSWLDSIAAAFKNLTDSSGNPIPVIFRPFHEVTGDWYWWGHDWCNNTAYKNMWNYTQHYLRDVKQVHQLLYVYAPNSPSDHWDRAYVHYYPGDDKVDLIGFDRYDTQAAYPTTLLADCREVVKFAKEKGKVPVIAETGITGGIQDVTDPLWFMNNFTEVIFGDSEGLCSEVAYALTWINQHRKDYWVPIGGDVTWPGFKKFYESSFSLFADDPAWINLRQQYSLADGALVPTSAPSAAPIIAPTPQPSVTSLPTTAPEPAVRYMLWSVVAIATVTFLASILYRTRKSRMKKSIELDPSCDPLLPDKRRIKVRANKKISG